MDRDKLIERGRKLFAMSQDQGSPAEADIAARRMRALMSTHDITIDELRGIDRDDYSLAHHEEKRRSSARRKRKSSSVRRKQVKRFTWSNFIVFVIAMCGLVFVFKSITTYTDLNGFQIPGSDVLNSTQPRSTTKTVNPLLTAKVERATVVEDELIVLWINGSGVSSLPETSSLLSSFRIIGTSVNEIDRTDGGVSVEGFQIRIEMQATKTGTLFIPSFYADGARSELIIINVLSRK